MPAFIFRLCPCERTAFAWRSVLVFVYIRNALLFRSTKRLGCALCPRRESFALTLANGNVKRAKKPLRIHIYNKGKK